jgi:hypothetical protein
MSLVLDLPPDLEQELASDAAKLGLPLSLTPCACWQPAATWGHDRGMARNCWPFGMSLELSEHVPTSRMLLHTPARCEKTRNTENGRKRCIWLTPTC